jgi:hypothetical protein
MSVTMMALPGQAPAPNGRIKGSVGDPIGLVIPRASVVIRAANDKKPLATAVTDEQGNYTFVRLAAGTYELRFDAQGFKPAVRRNVIVRTGEETVLPRPRLAINLDEAICILTVTAEAPSKAKQIP